MPLLMLKNPIEKLSFIKSSLMLLSTQSPSSQLSSIYLWTSNFKESKISPFVSLLWNSMNNPRFYKKKYQLFTPI